MPQYKHKRTGKIISEDEGVKMLSVWEPLSMPELRIPNPANASETPNAESAPGLQTFETVVELKKSADKSSAARTVRGAIYEYTDGQWVKVGG